MRLTALGFAVLVLLTACGSQPPAKRPLSPAAENRIRGQIFLDENKSKPGVVVLPSGLQYRILREGTGDLPGPGSTVRVHYRGMFIDRKEFESSREGDGQPAVFPLKNVIRGWQEGLSLMPVGSVWELYIPSNLAYGLDRAPERIGPNQTLVFEVELLGIVTSSGAQP